MKIAFMFPGQGSQFVGMGKDIYEKYQEAKEVYEHASDILGIDVKKLCFESSEEELTKTENTQIAIAVTSLAVLAVLKKNNINAEAAVGLSLGEYVALMYANYITIEDGLKLLKKRGYFMGNYIPKEEFSMAAIIGLDSEIIENVCNEISEDNNFVAVANYNCKSQTVISGNSNAVDKAIEVLKEKGAKKAVKLKTGGPFHTLKMEEARKLYSEELKNVNFNMENSKIKVIKNINGEFYNKDDNFKQVLSEHIVSPVRFDKAIELMKNNGIDTFIEIGPGKTMSGFVKKDLKDLDIKCYQTENLEQLENTICEIKNMEG